MKRFFTLIGMICCSLSVLFGISFQPFTTAPLYPEGIANPYAMTSSFGVQRALNNDQRQNTVYAIITEHQSDSQKTFYDFLPYSEEAQKPEHKESFLMKGGISLGLARVSVESTKFTPSLDFELNLGGYVSTVMNLFSKNDSLSYDGVYFLGASARIAHRVSLRFGLHHFSGHYGDELLEKLYTYHEVDFSHKVDFNNEAELTTYNSDPASTYTYTLNGLVEYVRDNSYLASVSVDLPYQLRLYGGVEMPMNPSWLRPFVHVPADYKNPVESDTSHPTLIDRIGGGAADGEGFPQKQLDEEEELKRRANGSYKALRVFSGFEWRYPLSFANLFLAGDLQFHQDGQTLHKVGGYDPANPWEMELTIGGGIEFLNEHQNRPAFRIHAFYHDGRAPSIQFFYQRMKRVTIALSIG